MEEKPKKRRFKTGVVSGVPKIDVHIPYDILSDDVPVISDSPSEIIRLMRDDAPKKTNEMTAIEKLLEKNIAFCTDGDTVTIEGRGHKFEYIISRDNWQMLGSAKAASGIDSLINLLLRR